MGDEGIAALAPLVQQGRMRRLERLDISLNGDITDRGIAESINMKGLPVLNSLYMAMLERLTAVGIGGIAHAIISGCPLLKRFHLLSFGPDDKSYADIIKDMLQVAGGTGMKVNNG